MMLRKLLLAPRLPFHIAKRNKRRITLFKGIKAMLENRNGEIPKQPLIAAGIISAVGALAAGALKLDHYLGSRGLKIDDADPEFIIDYKPAADKTLILFGGLCMHTDEVAERYKSQLASDTNLIAPIFPETGFDPKSIYEKTLAHIEEINPSEIYIAGLSMGGLLGWDLIAHGLETGRKEIVERVKGVAVRGTPFGKDAIRFGPRMLLNTVSRLGYSYTLDRGRSLVKNQSYKSLLEASPAKVVPQCRYLAGNHANKISVVPEQIIYIRGELPDPIVSETTAARSFEHRIGKPVEMVVDHEFQLSEHAPTDKRSAWFMLNQLGIAKPVAAQQSQPQLLLPPLAA